MKALKSTIHIFFKTTFLQLPVVIKTTCGFCHKLESDKKHYLCYESEGKLMHWENILVHNLCFVK
jgi:hypothetical protein